MARKNKSGEILEVFDAERLFGEFFKNPKIGLAVIDERLRYLAVNSCLAASNGVPVESHLGKHLRDILGDVALQAEPSINQVFSTAQPVVNCEIAGVLPTKPGGGHWIDAFFPITDSNGRVTQVGALVVEMGNDTQLQPLHPHALPAKEVLRSWKDIAQYMGACVKTVQRWEQAYKLPVRRMDNSKGAVVFALRNEVDDWLRRRT